MVTERTVAKVTETECRNIKGIETWGVEQR